MHSAHRLGRAPRAWDCLRWGAQRETLRQLAHYLRLSQFGVAQASFNMRATMPCLIYIFLRGASSRRFLRAPTDRATRARPPCAPRN
eukprot:7253882-Pyramimonas_sp.AAC.1